jgi:hypothetical protein
MKTVEATLGDDCIERHVPRTGFEMRHALQLIADADQLRSTPAGSGAAMRAQLLQATVVEAGAAAQPPSMCIDRDQWNEHEIEMAHGDSRSSGSQTGDVRFRDAIAVYPHASACIEGDEAHAVATVVGDDRQVEVATTLARERDDVREVGFAAIGEIDRNAARWAQIVAPEEAGELTSGVNPFRCAERATQGSHSLAQALTLGGELT